LKFDAVVGKWTETVLAYLSNPSGPSQPEAALIIDSHGNLYGTTVSGGLGHVNGTVFEVIPNPAAGTWAVQMLHSFVCGHTCLDGANPEGNLIMDGAGKLYGTTSIGGIYGGGTVFEMSYDTATAKWTKTTLHSFCAQAKCGDGQSPYSGLIMDSSGNLYGTTLNGGAYGGAPNKSGFYPGGTVFELVRPTGGGKWTVKVLHSFCAWTGCADGASPWANLLRDNAGNLYGTTNSGGATNSGTVFELVLNTTTGKWAETVLHDFCNWNAKTQCADGGKPYGNGLITDNQGNLYGAATAGGSYANSTISGGAVFELAK
jgi:hypothetical protein